MTTKSDRCLVAFHDQEQQLATLTYEYKKHRNRHSFAGTNIPMHEAHEVYAQLLAGEHYYAQSAQIGQVACFQTVADYLFCPISHDLRVIGNLVLTHPPGQGFDALEIRLVEQVANQCAIALRQARLYQEAQSQVAELQKLAQLKNDFLSTVSHELRTPMTNIKMAVVMLKEHVVEPRGQRYMEILENECTREINLINDLLELQRIEADDPNPVNLQPIYLEQWLPSLVAPYLIRTHKQQQTFHLTIAELLPPLLCDTAKLHRILTELLNNACKYTTAQGTIVMRADMENKAFRFTVSNTGTSIAPPELERMFEKFYRIPNDNPWQQGGTGLGLALVKSLIKQLRGTITAMSVDGYTTFTIMLPNQPQ